MQCTVHSCNKIALAKKMCKMHYARVGKYSNTEHPSIAKFWARGEKGNNKCIVWQGVTLPNGYGKACYQGKQWLAHRLAYHLARGAIPTGMLVCHKCDNPPCINPEHLYAGTTQDNVNDKVSRRHLVKEHHPMHKLTKLDVLAIHLAHNRFGKTRIELAKTYGVCYGQISRIIRKEQWK